MGGLVKRQYAVYIFLPDRSTFVKPGLGVTNYEDDANDENNGENFISTDHKFPGIKNTYPEIAYPG
jgi:hypothetical protein